jgi:1-acyl-sn-glycerol-3-phosphate acyltransferase
MVRNVVAETHPQWKHLLFTPNTHLERDLCLNKFARLKLCMLIEKALNITLDKTDFIKAATPLELLRLTQIQIKQKNVIHKKDKSTKGANNTDVYSTRTSTSTEFTHTPTDTPHNSVGEYFYAIYAWSVFLILGLAVYFLMVITPSKHLRQKIACASTQILFKCTFTSLHVSGRNHLNADQPQVIVANHTSYLDCFILVAALGIPLHFIAKEELSHILPIRLILQRFGVEFVDRFNARSGTNAIWRIARKSRNCNSIVFFPEGTFTSFAGLQPFRMGAFITAARINAPIVPIAINGARKILRGKHWFPHRGHIDVTILPQITPDANCRKNVINLRDSARHKISAFCGEPDLVELTTNPAWGIHANSTKIVETHKKPEPGRHIG